VEVGVLTGLVPADVGEARPLDAAALQPSNPPPSGLPIPGGTTPPSPPGGEPPATVAVRRTGGFAGTTKVGQLDLNSDPEALEVRHLLMRVGRQEIVSNRPSPDRFVYTVEYGDWRFTVPEQDLTPELRRLVQVVLDRRPDSGEGG